MKKIIKGSLELLKEGQYMNLWGGTAITLVGLVTTFERVANRVASKVSLEEAMYRSLEKANPQTLINACQTLNNGLRESIFSQYIGDLITYGATGIGVCFIASGVYNLAKKFRTEEVCKTKEI